MDHILDHYNGMIGITDDVVVHSKDDEHDSHLNKLMEVACENDLVFSGGKHAVEQKPSVTFFLFGYEKDGAHPHPTKLSAVQNMPHS